MQVTQVLCTLEADLRRRMYLISVLGNLQLNSEVSGRMRVSPLHTRGSFTKNREPCVRGRCPEGWAPPLRFTAASI